MTTRVLTGVVLIVLVCVADPVLACDGSCINGPLGCQNLGARCFDPWTGCGVCSNIIPFIGPCVCDPVGRPPTGWGAEGPEEEEGSQFGVRLRRRSLTGGDGFSSPGTPLPVPVAGDQLCAEQIGSATIVHRYNLPWGFATSDRLRIENARFCVEILGSIDGDGQWLVFRVTELEGFLPSFSPSALPVFETGDNHVGLDDLPSRGKLHLPTGTVLAEVRARLGNDLFGLPFSVPLRAGVRGKLDLDQALLTIERAQVDAATPSDYQGPFPD